MIFFKNFTSTRTEKKQKKNSIAANILEVATSLSIDINRVIVSGLIQRNDQYWGKVDPLNNPLKSGASSRNIGFPEHIDYRYYLNRSNLHLNRKGLLILTQNFDEFKNDFLDIKKVELLTMK